MRCADCRAGEHQRVETAVLVRETVTLRWYVCECGVCPQPCRTEELAVETSFRWHHVHRGGDGAVLVAPAAVWAAQAAAARADAARDAAKRAAARRHRLPDELGRATGPTPGGQGTGELAIGGVGGHPRHGVGVMRRSTPAASSPARFDLDRCRQPERLGHAQR